MAASAMASSLTVFAKYSRFCFSSRVLSFNTSVQSRLLSQWHLVGALCLQRKPIVSQGLSPIEEEFKAYLDKVEFENSLLNDHELKVLEDLNRASKSKDNDFLNSEVGFGKTAQDEEDAYAKELSLFQPASRITDADHKNDTKSLERHLDKSLILLVKQKLGNDAHWGLPQAVRQDGETMRQVAERVCTEICGNKLQTMFLGNAPVGYYKYKYPKAARNDGIIGAKVFFFKAWCLKGDMCLETFKKHSEAEDYMWCTSSELAMTVSQKDYRKTILKFLVEDDQCTETEDNSQMHNQEQSQQLQASN